jgi:modulator of FtsH protease
MTGYTPADWSDFALAQVGASAALLGLVFVGISINLRDFVDSRTLVNRAFEAIVMLASA